MVINTQKVFLTGVLFTSYTRLGLVR